MKKCESCGKEISKKAKVCPNCGEDQRNFFMKHKVLTVIITLVLLGFIGGMLGSSDEEPGPESVGSENSEQVDEEESVEDVEFGIGENVELDGQVVTVTDVEFSNGVEFDEPSEGNEYVIVHVTIDNNSDEEISYNPFNFRMENSKGQIESMGLITIDNDTSLSSGELRPEGSVSGTISFEEPIDNEGLKLLFEPSFWSEGKEIVFDLNK